MNKLMRCAIVLYPGKPWQAWVRGIQRCLYAARASILGAH